MQCIKRAGFLMAAVSGLTFCATGGVFDDARAWFNGAVDANGDGVFQTGEWREIRHGADATHSFHGTKLAIGAEASDRMTIVREDVICPYRNATLFDFPCLGFPHPAETNELVTVEGTTYPVVSVTPNFLMLPDFLSDDDAAATCTAYTAVLRFRYDEPVSRVWKQQSTLLQIGFNWAKKSGVAIGLSQANGDAAGLGGARRLMFYCGQSAKTENTYFQAGGWVTPYIYPGSWVDLAVRVRGQNVLLAYTWSDMQDGSVAVTNRHVRFWSIDVATPHTPAILPEARRFCLGGEQASSTPITFTNGLASAVIENNALKCFRGCVQQYAFWTRALSDDEIREAFGAPRPGLVRLGVPNGTSDEFLATTNAVHADGQWQRLDPALTEAGTRLDVAFTADTAAAGLPQHLRVRFAARPSGRPLPDVSLNGQSLTRIEADAGDAVGWFVPKNMVVAGTNTISLVRTDTAADPLVVDALELGGSWQLGGAAGRADDYFTYEGYGTNVFHLTDGNTPHFKRGLSGMGDNRFDEIVFSLAEGVGGACSATYSLLADNWSGTAAKVLSLSVNGVSVGDREVVVGTETSWRIPAAALHAGANVLRLEKAANDNWLNIRCHRFALGPVPRGALLIVR